MNRRTFLIGASSVAIIAFAGSALLLRQQQAATEEAAAAAAPVVDATLLQRSYSPSFGPEDAPVTLVEFFDPSCEACRAFHPVIQEIRQKFPTQVRIVMRYAAFHEGSDEAVRILETARIQDKFEPVLNALFDRQPDWAVHGAPRLDVAWEVAGAAGLDLERAKTDRLFPGIMGVLNQDKVDVVALEISQTPTFFLNGKRLTNFSPQSLIEEVSSAVQNS